VERDSLVILLDMIKSFLYNYIKVEHLNGLQSVVLFKDVKFPRKSSADFKAEQYKVTKQ
jgi:hypothetical protein